MNIIINIILAVIAIAMFRTWPIVTVLIILGCLIFN